MKEVPEYLKEKVECLYPKCKQVPTCRAEDPEYSYHDSHGRGYPRSENGGCPSPFDHKYICDDHWDLLNFIRDSDIIQFDVQLRRR